METLRVCKRCQKPLPPQAPEGLCPQCLAGAALGSEPAAPGPRVPPRPAQLAAQFPQMEIIELLGAGGMGMVYKARQPRLDRLVALKILPIDSTPGASFSDRFEREARALARLNHPGIVTLYDFGQTPEHYYFIMEYVDGLNLRQLIQAKNLQPRQALELITQICTALQFAHDEKIVHRDIKPENILITKKGQVKIADFGLAKLMGSQPDTALTASQMMMGTMNYMAPEQREKPLEVDHRADIYSLGVVFYEMLTGEVPMGRFDAPSKKVQIDVRLDEVVLHALEREPARRYQQASEIKSGVETIVATKSNPMPPPSQPATQIMNTRNMNTNTRKSFWPALVASVLVVTALAAWFLPRNSHDPEKASQLAREGWALWQNQKLDDAKEKFREAVRINPNDATAWNGLGWASFNKGDSKEAEKAFQKVIAIEPNHPAALNGLGQIYLMEQKYDMAEMYLLKAAPQAPAAWFGLARLYLMQDKYDDAAKWAGKVVESGQGDETAKLMLQAAKDKHISDGLRVTLGLPAAQ